MSSTLIAAHEAVLPTPSLRDLRSRPGWGSKRRSGKSGHTIAPIEALRELQEVVNNSVSRRNSLNHIAEQAGFGSRTPLVRLLAGVVISMQTSDKIARHLGHRIATIPLADQPAVDR